MPNYIQRSLAPTLLKAPAKVIILEGARAVGKTALVKTQLVQEHGYHYETLVDPVTFQRAKDNPLSWASSLPLPAVIDEAQLLPALTLAIKERVDELPPSPTPLFVLTGSASIGRDALGGQDPLVRRSIRLTLDPLTQSELVLSRSSKGAVSKRVSIVDKLWDYAPNEAYRATINRSQLAQMMSVGGFPRYAVELAEQYPTMSETERNLSVRSDIDGVLGDTLLPEERLDKAIAQAILDDLLSHPGEILNVSRIATELNYNVKTVERYISILLNRFLVYSLPNIRARAGKQPFTRSKIHPTDTSFSAALFARSGGRPLEHEPEFGNVLESFVVNQIRPESQWSQTRPDCFYWREPGKSPREVDLVLLHNNELIGVEVKASPSVGGHDFNGLRALSRDKRFRRGFVFYTGSQVVKKDENLWAIPISALWDEGAFLPKGDNVPKAAATRTGELSSIPPQQDANVFLSYSHEDDEHLRGAIIQLAHEIANEYQFRYASTLKLFIDKESINWGEDWRRAIREGLDGTNYLIPAVTPRYLRSPACRDELLQFMGQLDEKKTGAVLSLVWQSYAPLSKAMVDDPVLQAVSSHQYISVEDLQELEPSSPAYRRRVKEIVEKLRATIEKNLASSNSSDAKGGTAEEPTAKPPGLGALEAADEVNDLMPQMTSSLNAMRGRFESISGTINANPLPSRDIHAMLLWSQSVADATEDDVRGLRDDIAAVSTGWDKLCNASRLYIKLLQKMPDKEQRQSALRGFAATLEGFKRTTVVPINQDELNLVINVLSSLSPRLKPLVSAIDSMVNLFGSMSSMTGSLLEQIDTALKYDEQLEEERAAR